MLRFAVPVLFASALTAAPVPELPKAVKERKAFLTDLGIPDTGQKLSPIPRDYQADNVTDAAVKADPGKYVLRAACQKVAEALLVHRSKPLPDTFSFVGGLKKAKEAMKVVQVTIATRTLDLTEAMEELADLPEKALDAERSKRWRANREYLIAAARLEIAALQEYNLALGRVLTEVVDPPKAEDGENALKLVPAMRMQSNRTIRGKAEDARREFADLQKAHPDTPWAALAEAARERTLGLAWAPTKVDPPKAKKK